MNAVTPSAAVDVVSLLRREARDRMANNFPRQADELHAAADAIAELIAAATRVANDRHMHDARGQANSETCARCGSNFRDTSRHFIVGESAATDMASLRAALNRLGGVK